MDVTDEHLRTYIQWVSPWLDVDATNFLSGPAIPVFFRWPTT